MASHLPAKIETWSQRLDGVLALILSEESPMDARVTAGNSPRYTLQCSEATFELEQITDFMFLVLVEHVNDMEALGAICGVDVISTGPLRLNFSDLFYALDEACEKEFMATSSSQQTMLTRYKLLAIIDGIAGISNIIDLKESPYSASSNLLELMFSQSVLFTRSLSIIYYLDKLIEVPQFENKDGVSDPRLQQYQDKNEEIHKRQFEKWKIDMRRRYEDINIERVASLQKKFQERYDQVVSLMLEIIPDKQRENRSKGGKNKAYIPTLKTVIHTFLQHTPCSNLDMFKKKFSSQYHEDSPCKIGTEDDDQYYIDSVSSQFYRQYITFNNKEEKAVVPDSTLKNIFKEAQK